MDIDSSNYSYTFEEYENHCKDGKLNGLSTWWCENGQIECEGFFKEGTQQMVLGLNWMKTNYHPH